MKAIMVLTLIFALVVATCMGCLMIFDVVSVERGTDLLLKSLAVILVLGVSSAVIALLIRNKNPGSD